MKFELEIWNSHQELFNKVVLEKVDSGWVMDGMGTARDKQESDKKGDNLFTMLRTDYYTIPDERAYCILSHIWDSLHDFEMNEQEAQIKLTELFDWISRNEKTKPALD
ncbi:hypothetical protein [Pseudoalteromonas sp. 1181_04]|uniref:hypothetical protein n=1 Tax=Pseudoalteromonas sp. 1181_04 TaxID=2604450 RepID=UPI004063BE84